MSGLNSPIAGMNYGRSAPIKAGTINTRHEGMKVSCLRVLITLLLQMAGFVRGFQTTMRLPTSTVTRVRLQPLGLHRSSSRRHSSIGTPFFDSIVSLFSSPTKGKQMSETEYKDTWLVVGDGDLSYSAALSQETGPDTRLIATVWEDEDRHNKVYRDSVKNTNIIRGTQAHEARFGVDATKLTDSFPGQQFDRIVFNFPHWPGKTNTRRNRKLMDEFLSSACKVLRKTPSSEIHVALCERQGGMDVSTIREWKASWKPTAFACEYGLLLRRLVPFQPQYNLSSFRGRDSGFPVGKNPQVYVFGWPSKDPSLPTADYRQQIAFRFELRLELDPEILAQCPFSQYDLVEGDIIPNLIRESVSDDYHCEVPIREIIMLLRSPNPLLGFLVVLAGHHKALTRAQAFQERLLVEEFVYNVLQFPTKKRGSHVSKAFPFYLLPSLMDDYASPVSVASSAELACSKKIRS